MKYLAFITLLLCSHALATSPQPDPTSYLDEFGVINVDWESVTGRTYYPRVSTDLENWNYLPGEVFLGDGTIQGLSFPPPLQDSIYVSLHFTDVPGAHLLTSDIDNDGYTLDQELQNNTDPNLFDAGGGGTGYAVGDPTPPIYPLIPGTHYTLNIEYRLSDTDPTEFIVVQLDEKFEVLSINGIAGGNFPIPGLPTRPYGMPDPFVELQLVAENPIDEERSLLLGDYHGRWIRMTLPTPDYLSEFLHQVRPLRIPPNETLSDKARLSGFPLSSSGIRLLYRTEVTLSTVHGPNEFEEPSPEAGLVAHADSTKVRYRVFPNVDKDTQLFDGYIQWYWRKMKADGQFGVWKPYGNGTSHSFDAIPADGGIYEVRVDIFGAGYYLRRQFDDPYGSSLPGGEISYHKKYGARDCLGVSSNPTTNSYLTSVWGGARTYLGSTAYRKDVEIGNFPRGKWKCNYFLKVVGYSHAPNPLPLSPGLVPDVNGRIIKTYPPTAGQWAGEPVIEIPNWELVGFNEDPEPGWIVARAWQSSDASGHCGIIDYDGAWVSAGKHRVHRACDLRDRLYNNRQGPNSNYGGPARFSRVVPAN